MPRRRLPWFAIVLLAALAVPLAAASPPTPASDALLAADRAFAAATAAHGAAGWGSFFAPDGIAVPPAGPLPQGGPAAAEAEMKGLFADPRAALRWTPEQAVIASAGDLGYTLGSYELQAGGPGGKLVTRTGRYLTVWRRQADGSWKVLADIGNVAPPAPTPAAATSPGKP